MVFIKDFPWSQSDKDLMITPQAFCIENTFIKTLLKQKQLAVADLMQFIQS